MEYISYNDVRVFDINSMWLGTSVKELMENAGRAVAEETLRRIKKGKNILVVCGTGNNGGDGLVAARYLAKAGFGVRVFVFGKKMKSRAAEKNLEKLRFLSSIKTQFSQDSEKLEIDEDVVIDALLGTGIRGEIKEPYKSAVNKIAVSKAFKVAVDLPSGMDSKGEGYFAEPDLVVTFIAMKQGLERHNTVVKDIGMPENALTFAGPGDLVICLRKRFKEAHKGDFGRVVVIGGSKEYHGAPVLSARGALGTGIDLVYLFVPGVLLNPVRSVSPDFIVTGYSGDRLTKKSLGEGKKIFDKADAAVIGPGLGDDSKTIEAVLSFLKHWNKPVVVDADALKALALDKEVLRGKHAILTPHAGELRRLSGVESENREATVKKVAEEFNATILLKGSTDIVASPVGRIKFNNTGNAGMTRGGTGDVLAGIAAGLLAQGAEPFYAACASAFINGYSGDRLFERKGYFFLASELSVEIPIAIKDVFSRVDISF
ncbi:MAG TPA: NAD(P)H-hydrate dehydratase [Euryarchaeota archaeon]|nr:bifunctional NAD(P)H-hydrate repair enzyme Nnr [archaeon BMS3Bbin15]HDL15295.1 NAD(P)H-hydrate dehydratase [Euryarchaeota archaeon]